MDCALAIMDNHPALEAVELLGGPLDGECVEAIPHVAVTAFVYADDSGRNVQWTPYVLRETSGGRRQIPVGFYGRHRDPRCRSWLVR
jgi:hypothetical protein